MANAKASQDYSSYPEWKSAFVYGSPTHASWTMTPRPATIAAGVVLGLFFWFLVIYSPLTLQLGAPAAPFKLGKSISVSATYTYRWFFPETWGEDCFGYESYAGTLLNSRGAPVPRNPKSCRGNCFNLHCSSHERRIAFGDKGTDVFDLAKLYDITEPGTYKFRSSWDFYIPFDSRKIYSNEITVVVVQ